MRPARGDESRPSIGCTAHWRMDSGKSIAGGHRIIAMKEAERGQRQGMTPPTEPRSASTTPPATSAATMKPRETHSEAQGSREMASADMIKRWLKGFGPFMALLLVIAIFAALSDNPSRFLSLSNLRIVLSQTVIVAIGAVAMTIIIVSGGIDLSPGSVIALT